jgi:hypothetical protein
MSEHNMILCTPTYKQKLKIKCCKEINVKRWSDDCIEALQDCFDYTL